VPAVPPPDGKAATVRGVPSWFITVIGMKFSSSAAWKPSPRVS
jgi:hypothetical protein